MNTIDRIQRSNLWVLNNLRASRTAARKKLGATGRDVKGPTAGSMQAQVEKRYPFLQRLDGIFGTRLNASLVTSLDTLNLMVMQPEAEAGPETGPETPLGLESQPPIEQISLQEEYYRTKVM